MIEFTMLLAFIVSLPTMLSYSIGTGTYLILMQSLVAYVLVLNATLIGSVLRTHRSRRSGEWGVYTGLKTGLICASLTVLTWLGLTQIYPVLTMTPLTTELILAVSYSLGYGISKLVLRF